MAGSHGPGDRVVEQHRGAVGGEDHQGGARVAGDEAVTLGIGVVVEAQVVTMGHKTHDVRVDLVGQYQLMGVETQGVTQNAVVFRNIFGVISPAHANVQTRQSTPADTPQPGGEAVSHRDPLG